MMCKTRLRGLCCSHAPLTVSVEGWLVTSVDGTSARGPTLSSNPIEKRWARPWVFLLRARLDLMPGSPSGAKSCSTVLMIDVWS